ncbi:hypothetical protein GOV12_05480 [Candidatus Pacearchaeota archaeon]|nr:hypothetical protein [Candidatus Pacearchaeota archaeon]
MFTLEFEILRIKTKSNYHQFRDDGFVDNMFDHYRKIWKEMHGSLDSFDDHVKRSDGIYDTDKNRTKEPEGAALNYLLQNGKLWIIFYKKFSPREKIRKRAHEETHVLHGTWNLSLLEEKMKKLGVNIPLTCFPDYSSCSEEEKEIVASLGGYYALHKRGIDLFSIEDDNIHDFEKKALKIYRDALQGIPVKVICEGSKKLIFT